MTGQPRCGQASSERAIIVDNRLVIADFGEISEKVGFDSQLQGVKEGRFAPKTAHLGAKNGP